MSAFELLAAVDVAGRRAVQAAEDGPGDPETVARRWVADGADRVHLVDLDRAYRRGSDLPYLAGLVARLPVRVQLSGGLDTPQAAAEALATGAGRVVLAAGALRDPAWVGDLVVEHGDRVAVGIDVDGDVVVARGSGELVGPLEDVLLAVGRHLGGRAPGAYVVADASRDGSLAGVDPDLYQRVVRRLDAPVVASGGVATTQDLLRLRDAGACGAVLGAALHQGRFTLEQAREALR